MDDVTRRISKATGCALLFALCGALSSRLFDPHVQGGLLLVPLPFALLFALLFLRTNIEIVAAPLFVIVWLVAYFSANYTAMAFARNDFTPVCVGGLIGGLGVTLRGVLPPQAAFPPIPDWWRCYWMHRGAPIRLLAALVLCAVPAPRSFRSVAARTTPVLLRDLAGGHRNLSVRLHSS